MTPADELHAAAAKLRAATPAEPAMARAYEPLARWLEAEAKQHAAALAAAANVWGSTGHPDAIVWLDTGAGKTSPHALAVARAVLGSPDA